MSRLYVLTAMILAMYHNTPTGFESYIISKARSAQLASN